MATGGQGRDSSNYQRMRKAFRNQCRRESARCWLCWQEIDYYADQYDDDSFSLDHMHPVSLRPDLAEVYENFRPSHRGCNTRRGNGAPLLDLGSPSRDW